MSEREFHDVTDEIAAEIAAVAADPVAGPVLTRYRDELLDGRPAARMVFLQELCRRIVWKDTNLAQKAVARIF